MSKRKRTKPYRLKTCHFEVPLSTEKMRTCLAINPDGTYCNRKFLSPSPAVRICPKCKHNLELKCPCEDSRTPTTQIGQAKAPY